MKKPLNLFTALMLTFCCTTTAFSQTYNSSTPYLSYYYDYKLANPAFTGSNGKHVITTMYSSFNYQDSFSKRATDRTFYASYEGRIDKYKTALGVQLLSNSFASRDYNQFGLFYSRKILLSEKSSLKIGAQLAFQRVVIDYSNYIPVDPNDPMLIQRSTESGVTGDLGIAYHSPVISIGVAAKSLINQIYSSDGVNLIVTRKFNLTNNLKLTPSMFYETDFKSSTLHLNSTVQIRRWILVGCGYSIIDGKNDLSFNIGLNILDWVNVITHAYSSGYQSLRKYTDSGYTETLVRVRIPGNAE